ncbi:MAG: calcium/proton transporter [Methylotetracoccus sp.]
MPVIVILAWTVWAMSQFMDGLLTHRSDPVALMAEGGGIFLLMLGCVFAVVRHADRLAEFLREPYGTLVLTMSSTTIEATLMLRVMHHGAQNPTLLRDTVFAVLMLSMNLMVGLALTAGAWRHREQSFKLRGALSFLQLIGSLCLLLLVLPNHTVSSQGATLAIHQEAFLGLLSVVVYLLFLVLQTGRHRGYFDTSDESISDRVATGAGPRPSLARVSWSVFGLLSALLPVVLLSEELGGAISFGIEALDAPTALGGLVIAGLGLIPEGLGALRAATANRIQRSVNICLGSALSTIGLTVPTVLIAAAGLNLELVLGLDGTNSTLLQASLFVAVLTFVSGRANALQGIIHLMLFLGYVMFILFP